jgi:hypothetical protein
VWRWSGLRLRLCRTSAIEQLAEKGVVIVRKKGSEWQVHFVRKDETGFLIDRQSEWGTNLLKVIEGFLENIGESR